MKPIFKDNKYSIRVFIGNLFIGIFILVGLFIFQYRTVFNSIADIVGSDLKAYKSHFDDRIADVAGDVFLIEELIKNRDVFELENGKITYRTNQEQELLENDLLDWMKNVNVFDQIRVLDNDGMEVLRINYSGGNPVTIPSEDLQDKSSRYYYQNAIGLEDDTLYLSKMDLNIENGEIEYVDGEPKQMLRLASTFYDDDGNKLGVIVVNYLAEHLFHDHETDDSQYTSFEVINEDGYFLHTLENHVEYGFMFDAYQDEVFSKYHDYDIFDNITTEITRNEYDDELYLSVLLDETQLSNAISESLNGDFDVYSDNGDILIFGEIEIYDTNEFTGLRSTYITLFIVYIVIVLIVTKLLDEIHFQRKERIRILEFSSNHDLLTGLPNRANIYKMIQYLTSRNKQFSVLFLDLDGFKSINDKYGHVVGDTVLIEAAKRMKNSVRQNDLVARLGGDEFIIILMELIDEDTIKHVVETIKTNMIKDMDIDNHICNVGVSIGISIQDGNKNVDQLINESDNQMYEDKSK